MQLSYCKRRVYATFNTNKRPENILEYIYIYILFYIHFIYTHMQFIEGERERESRHAPATVVLTAICRLVRSTRSTGQYMEMEESISLLSRFSPKRKYHFIARVYNEKYIMYESRYALCLSRGMLQSGTRQRAIDIALTLIRVYLQSYKITEFVTTEELKSYVELKFL